MQVGMGRRKILSVPFFEEVSNEKISDLGRNCCD